MASVGEMSLNETANVIPWFATGRTGAHIDLNTSRDWRRDPEDGITEDDIHAPLHEHREHHQDVHEEGHNDSTKKTHKHHHHHKGHHHHHKRKTGSSHSNRISPGGREALESSLPNTPYLPTLPPSEGGGDDDQQPEKAQYNRIPMDDWVKRWEGKKENVKSLLNINRYATKKTISQGMLDIALFASNASQLKYLMQVGEVHEYYTEMVALVVTSIVLQIIVGLLFFLIAMINVNDEESHASAKILNNIILVIVFIITLINAFINGFGIKHTDTAVAATMENRNIR